MTLIFVQRDEWGAEPPRDTVVIKPQERKGLTIHHNGPELKLDTSKPWLELVEQEKRKVRAIQRFHMGTKGWIDIAYSWLVGQSGCVYVCRGSQWRQIANGSDVVGINDGTDRQWYTAMWMGGGAEVPTPQAVTAMTHLVQYVRDIGAGDRVLPHSDFKVKACPGPEFTAFARHYDQRPIDSPEEDDMTPVQAQQLQQVWEAIFGGTGGGPIGERLREIHEGIRPVAINQSIAVPDIDYDTLAAKVADEISRRMSG